VFSVDALFSEPGSMPSIVIELCGTLYLLWSYCLTKVIWGV